MYETSIAEASPQELEPTRAESAATDEPERDAPEYGEFLRLRAARGGQLSILSTLPFKGVALWRDNVETLKRRDVSASSLAYRIGLVQPGLILDLLRRAPKADVVLLNGGERVDLIYLALAGLLPWIRTPHVIVDAHWQAKDGILGALQPLLLRLGRRLLAEVQPHSPEEIEILDERFGVPSDRVRPLVWSTSLSGYEDIRPRSTRDRVVVSGGHSYRDYPTLFDGVVRAGLRLRIGLPDSPVTASTRRLAEEREGIEIVSDWTIRQYWQAVADATVFAMPIPSGLTRCTADQTILNAMSFGTVVVATSAISSRLYIRHGENGFLVPPDDPQAWARTLRHVFELPPEEYARISHNAMSTIERDHREDTRLARTLVRAARNARL
jgi:glycosyltransferase involved in cell wall biosynthesis